MDDGVYEELEGEPSKVEGVQHVDSSVDRCPFGSDGGRKEESVPATNKGVEVRVPCVWGWGLRSRVGGGGTEGTEGRSYDLGGREYGVGLSTLARDRRGR